MKKALDVCCGSRAMWFDKNDDRCLYLDIRKVKYENDNARGYKTLDINPDMICDFTKLPFNNDTFYHIVFDPPHLKRNGFSGEITKRYGILQDGWEEMIRKGFKECFRVLKQNGTLVFKWSEVQIPLKDVLKLTKHKALYGHKSGKRMNTHWVCFIKD